MRRCSAVQTTCRSWQARRWTSYDRSALTDEALTARIEKSLGKDEHGRPGRIDIKKKTVSTAGGDLPISPLFQPSWIRSRKRVAKEPAGKPSGRFRRKLIRNPFARALASPIRFCSLTQVALPRFFLQDFEVINHPETSDLWFAAGPLAFEKVQPKYWTSDTEKADTVIDAQDAARSEEVDQEGQDGGTKGKSTIETVPPFHYPSAAAGSTEAGSENSTAAAERRGRAPITAYTLSNKALLDKIGTDSKSGPKLIGGRSGMSYTPASRAAVFRSDMGDVILKMMRQTLVDALVARSTHGGQIERIDHWADAGEVRERGSVLVLQADESQPDASSAASTGGEARPPFSEYTTLDVDGAKYDGKMPVYDLTRLLGNEEVARLRASAAATFGRDESGGRSVQQKYVLKRKSSHSSTNLHLLLWRLEGYLAENRAPAA